MTTGLVKADIRKGKKGGRKAKRQAKVGRAVHEAAEHYVKTSHHKKGHSTIKHAVKLGRKRLVKK